MSDFLENFNRVHARIKAAAREARRDSESIQLLAVTKKQPVDRLREAYELTGQRLFGENYVQEGLPKIKALRGLPLEWHFIGPLQSNKVKEVAEHFDWVHSVDRLKVAEKLNHSRPLHLPPLNICIQVNVDYEENKSGIFINEINELIYKIKDFCNLKLRGLMAIPRFQRGLEEQRKPFSELYNQFNELRQQGVVMDTLSMGMSEDLEAAILEGATMIRVGTALFGKRG